MTHAASGTYIADKRLRWAGQYCALIRLGRVSAQFSRADTPQNALWTFRGVCFDETRWRAVTFGIVMQNRSNELGEPGKANRARQLANCVTSVSPPRPAGLRAAGGSGETPRGGLFPPRGGHHCAPALGAEGNRNLRSQKWHVHLYCYKVNPFCTPLANYSK